MELSDKKNRAKAIADYRDYCFGRATQYNENKVTGEVKVTQEEQEQISQKLKENGLT